MTQNSAEQSGVDAPAEASADTPTVTSALSPADQPVEVTGAAAAQGSPVGQTPARRTPARKAPARKAPARSTTARKAPARTTTTRATTARKAPARARAGEARTPPPTPQSGAQTPDSPIEGGAGPATPRRTPRKRTAVTPAAPTSTPISDTVPALDHQVEEQGNQLKVLQRALLSAEQRLSDLEAARTTAPKKGAKGAADAKAVKGKAKSTSKGAKGKDSKHKNSKDKKAAKGGRDKRGKK